MVASPVGYRCPECSRTKRSVVYDPSVSGLVRAAAAGLVSAAAIGFFWGSYPTWGFYMALLMGFGVAEAVAWGANYKRGRELQVLAMGMILIGVLVSRVTIGMMQPGLSLDMLLNNSGDPFVQSAFYLRVIPDILFVVVSFVIGFVRFR